MFWKVYRQSFDYNDEFDVSCSNHDIFVYVRYMFVDEIIVQHVRGEEWN